MKVLVVVLAMVVAGLAFVAIQGRSDPIRGSVGVEISGHGQVDRTDGLVLADFSGVAANVTDNTVYVFAVVAEDTQEEYTLSATGFSVGSVDAVVTASHAVGFGRADSIWVKFRDGDYVPYRVRHEFRAWDLAVLEPIAGPWRNRGGVYFDDRANLGEPVVRSGYSATETSFYPLLAGGIVAGSQTSCLEDELFEPAYCIPVLMVDVDGSYGHSGGPVFNAAGALIGMSIRHPASQQYSQLVDLTLSSEFYREAGGGVCR